MRVSAIIPAKVEPKTIKDVIKDAQPHVDEVIVVISKNNGSKTLEALNGHLTKIIVDNGLGKGDALKCGIEEATGEIIVFIDADGSHIANDVPRLVNPIKTGKADLVIASRTLGGSEEFKGNVSKRLRVFFSSVITLVINKRFGSKITDSQNGFRAIRKDTINSLNLMATGFDIETEMLMKALKKGYVILEVPSKELRRKFGRSGINMLTMGWRYAYRLFLNLF